MNFTENQHRAIAHNNGNLQLIACAGSGKTEVVARRVAELLAPDGCGLVPDNIIAFTFTEKAAAEKGLARYSDWTAQELAARRAEIVAWALVRWHFEPADVELQEEDDAEEVTMTTEEAAGVADSASGVELD